MANTLQYIGKTQTAAADLVNQSYLAALLGSNMSQSTVDSLLSSGFSTYVTKSYVDSQDALNATKSYIDTADNTRLKLSNKGVNNGIAPLDATGRIPSSRINVTTTQRWLKGFWTPSAYFASPVSTVSETTLYTASVSDPGFTYKLLCFGLVDSTAVDGTSAQVLVRVGSTSGTIVASGYGLSEAYGYTDGGGGDTFSRADSTTTLGSSWTQRVPTTGVGLGILNQAAYIPPPAGNGNLVTIRVASTFNTPAVNDDVQLSLVISSVAGSTATSVSLLIGADTTGVAAGLLYSTGFDSINASLASIFSTTTDYSPPTRSPFPPSNGTEQSSATSLLDLAVGDTLTLSRAGNVYSAKKNGAAISGLAAWTDSGNIVPRDSSHRLFGFGCASITTGGSGNPVGYGVDSVSTGSIPNGGPATLVPVSLSGQTALTGASTLYVRLVSTGSSSVTATTFNPQLYVMAVPA